MYALVLLVGCGVEDDSGSPPSTDTGPPADTGSPITDLAPSVTWSATCDQRLGASLTSGPGARLVIGGPSRGSEYWEDTENSTIYLINSLIGSLSGGTIARAEGDYVSDSGGYANTLLGTEVVLPGDVTGDGEPDLLAFTSPGDSDLSEPAYLFPGPLLGSHSVTDPGVLPVAGRDAWSGVRCGDLDGNGVDELCHASGVAFGPVGPSPEPGLTWSAADPAGMRIAAADLDGDGVNDLLLADPASSALVRLTSFAAGDVDLASAAEATWTAPMGHATAMVAGDDLDGDGRGDIAVAWNDGAATTVYLLVDAGGSAMDEAATAIALPAVALTTGDLDSDGVAELAAGGDGSVWVFSGPIEAGGLEGGDASAHLIGAQHPDDSFGAALLAIESDDALRWDLVVGAPDVHSDSPYEPYGEVYLFRWVSL